MIRRRRHRNQATALMITPMIDMFTVILIFLIINFSPEASKIKRSTKIELPQTEKQLEEVAKLQIEISHSDLRLNGEVLGSLASDKLEATYASLRSKISKGSEKALLMADQGLDYKFIDRTVATLAAEGIGQIYFLTEK